VETVTRRALHGDPPRANREKRLRIGMFTTSLEDAYTSTLIKGVGEFTQSVDADLLVYVIGSRAVADSHATDYSIADLAALDGIILTGGLAWRGPDAWEELIAFRDRCLATSDGPLPLTGTSMWLEGVPAVVPSSYEGMREVVEHLIDVHGCRRVGFIGGPETANEAKDRYRAYADALAARDLQVNPEWLVHGDFTRPGGVAAARRLFANLGYSRPPALSGTPADTFPLDALVCASDEMAMGALDVLQQYGLRVPEDLALTGFDDSEVAGRAFVPLTTVRQPVYDVGYRAAAILWRRIQGEVPAELSENNGLILPTRMVVRRSCGCLPEPVTQAAIASTSTESAGEPFTISPTSLVMFEDLRDGLVAELMTRARAVTADSPSTVSRSARLASSGEDVVCSDDAAVPGAVVDAFWAELRSSAPEMNSHFVRTLAKLMRPDHPEMHRWDWHAMVSILRRATIPLLGERLLFLRAEDLLQQARSFIGEARVHTESYRYGEAQEAEAKIRELTDSVASLEDLELALATLELGLGGLSVHAYAVLRSVQANARDDNPGPQEGQRDLPLAAQALVRLERAYACDAEGTAETDTVPGGGSVYPLAELLPDVAWQALAARQRMWIVLPFIAGGQTLGFGLFNGELKYPEIYLRLRQALIAVILRSDLIQGQLQARREAEAAALRAETALRDALIAQQRYISQAWVDPSLQRVSARSGEVRGYERTPEGEGIGDEAWLPAMTQAVTRGETVVERDEEGETLALPLLLYGQEVIGTLGFWRPLSDSEAERTPWSDGQIRLVENVADQMAQALETQRLFSDSHRRAARLATAAEVSSAATSMTDLSQLLTEAVTLIQDRFGLYYTGLFLMDHSQTWAVLVAGTGKAGATMVGRSHRLAAGGNSMIGRCVASGQAQIASDTSALTGSDVIWSPNPLLPDTRSELALPLVSRGTVIGAMTIQDVRPGAFTEGDITTLQTMADQLGNAIENARLLEQMERTLREVELATGRYTQETWRDFIRERMGPVGYRYRLVNVTSADDPRPEALAAIEQDAVVMVSGTESTQNRSYDDSASELTASELTASELTASELTVSELAPSEEATTTAVGLPIRLRNQVMGAVNLRFEGDTVAPEVVRMVEQVAERLAVSLESARLLEESRRTAERERLVGDVSRRIRQSLEVDEVLQSSVREIRDAMDLFRVSVRLAPRSDES
jgi:DNA-binding LacI/PurR family transcriptional regulator/GAF domain-containing protein